MTQERTDDLTGRIVVDSRGATYIVDRHHVEADELTLRRDGRTHAITLMDVADGPYEVL